MKSEGQSGLEWLAELRKVTESVACATSGELVSDFAASLSGMLPGHQVGVVLHEQGATSAAVEPPSPAAAPNREALLHAFHELSGIGRGNVSPDPAQDVPALQVPVLVGENVVGLLACMRAVPEPTSTAESMLYVAAELLGPTLATRAAWMPLAYRDPLTDLYNRRWLIDELRRALAAARRHRLEVSVIMLDLDGFKAINDTAGHAEGDRLLCHVAAALADRVRREDAVCRYGGDEFVVVLPRTSSDGAARVAGRLADCVEEVTLSFGVAASGTGEAVRSPEDLLDRADRELLKAKGGR